MKMSSQTTHTDAVPNPSQENKNTMVVRIPKPNVQVIVLGLIAVVTLFQTFQLVRISAKAGSASAKTVSTPTSTNSGSSGTGSGTDVPQSMVGGC